MARMIHYGKKFLRKVRSVKQGSDATAGLGKPCGLWVSVEGEQDWKEWCEAEQFGCLDCATQVILKPEARILWLRGTVGLDKFHEEYSFEQYRSGTYTWMAIRWPSVALTSRSSLADAMNLIITVLKENGITDIIVIKENNTESSP